MQPKHKAALVTAVVSGLLVWYRTRARESRPGLTRFNFAYFRTNDARILIAVGQFIIGRNS